MSLQEFKSRRERLAKEIAVDAVVIMPAAAEKQRNNDVEYPYRQESNFYYLTGFVEPQSVAVILIKNGDVKLHLFCLPKDSHAEMWNGKRVGVLGAKRRYGADFAYPIDKLSEKLPKIIDQLPTKQKHIFYTLTGDRYSPNKQFDDQLLELLDISNTTITSPAAILHELRLFKSKEEIAMIRQAAEISANAHRKAMHFCQVRMSENQLEAVITNEFISSGADYAYPSIVAAGDNACVLHYTENSSKIKSKELLLIDAGAEYKSYAADITRTFPASGKFSDEQLLLYKIVLAAQKSAIKQIRPGVTFEKYHQAATRVITKGLVKLGIVQNTKQGKKEVKKIFPHRTGHWLGIDVHDVGEYKQQNKWRKLQPGMVVTVEPGIYIPKNMRSVAARWRGIGIRIEDNVLVTKHGNEILTAMLPSEPDGIEKLCQ